MSKMIRVKNRKTILLEVEGICFKTRAFKKVRNSNTTCKENNKLKIHTHSQN